MTTETIRVPDLGGAESVDVIEVCVAVGDSVEVEQSILVLESDKASMEIPCPMAGTVTELLVKEGDSLSEGSAVLELSVEVSDQSAQVIEQQAPVEEASMEPAPAAVVDSNSDVTSAELPASSSEDMVLVPDVGSSDAVEVIELCVAEGDEVSEGDSLVVLESDKASMEIPAPAGGTIVALKVSEGDKVNTGDPLALMSMVSTGASVEHTATPSVPAASAPATSASDQTASQVSAASTAVPPKKEIAQNSSPEPSVDSTAYAGPAARKLARQMGVDLTRVTSSGPRKRVTREDVRVYVQKVVQQVESGSLASGSGIPPIPKVDFAQFGDVELVKLSKIAKVTVQNMSRSWLNVPHVTQFDDADITDMEAFRKSMKAEAEAKGVKLTPLPFLMKAAAAALINEPAFNASLHADGEHKVQKKYVHIGMAVDTPNGLMVPVIRDVDKKSLWELSEETAAMAAKARAGKLMPRDMQGGCFTISSLGAIGGKGFTPIVNAPEVAIMGVSKAQIQPVWDGSEFVPRQMLPLSISYDHRVINGADCGRFFTFLVAALSDIRRLLM